MKRIFLIQVLILLLLVGCGTKGVSNDNGTKSKNDSLDAISSISYDKLVDSFTNMIKTNSLEGYIDNIPEESIEYYDGADDINEELHSLYDIWKEKYGEISSITSEIKNVKSYDVQKLRKDMEYDVDIIESIHKGLKCLLRSNCNLEKCAELTVDLSIHGNKKNDKRELKYFFVYQIDGQWYTDPNALYILHGYEEELKEYEQRKKEKVESYEYPSCDESDLEEPEY